MATTGFWPVKGQLKKVLDYADNPEKTASDSAGNDLEQALSYAADGTKTGKLLYVHGINTLPEQAYENMLATKRRFGKLGGNVAYHGYQSFKAGEVTPREAHEIGMETARRMWGRDYEVLVTTHLNTDHLHNHFVVNSVSFRDGRKFLNKKSDHIRLREISDEICAARKKSVLKEASFYSGNEKAYWAKRAGQPTHREILKRDVEDALKTAIRFETFESNLKKMGYVLIRNREYRHMSVKAPGWKRAVRLDKIGFSNEYLQQRLEDNLIDDAVRRQSYEEYYRKKEAPLFYLLKEYAEARPQSIITISGIQHIHPSVYLESAVSALKLIMVLLAAFSGKDVRWLASVLGIREPLPEGKWKPLSPEMRQEVTKLKEYDAQTRLLASEHIETDKDLEQFINRTGTDLEELEKRRYSLRLKERREKIPDKKEDLRKEIKSLTASIVPLRKKLRMAEDVQRRSSERTRLLKEELLAERDIISRDQDRRDLR